MPRTVAVAVAALGLLAVAPGIAAADPPDTLYVDAGYHSTCSDTGTGTQALPFCTAQKAADVVTPGQTVKIAGGSGPVVVRRSGAADAPIVFLGYNPNGYPGGITGTGGGGTALTIVDSHDIVVRELRITGTTAITGHSSRVSVIRDELDIVNGNTDPHVEVDGGDGTVVIANNVLHGGSDGRGIVLNQAPGVVVTSNTVVGACDHAVTVTGASPGVSVENNLVGSVHDSSGSARCVGDAAAISVDAAASAGVTADYNLVYTASKVQPYSWAGAGYADAAALTAATGQGRHDLNSDPKLSPQDYVPVLHEGSPAIDSANADAPGELPQDFYGSPRVDDPTVPNTGNGIHDRGAFEFIDSWTANDLTVSATRAPVGGAVTVNGNLSSTWNLPFTCDISFGDGSSTSVSPCQASHSYAATGTYTITTKAHNDGGLSYDYQNTVTVVPAGGTFTPSVTATPDGALGVTATVGAGSDPWNIASATLDFGDGSGSVNARDGGTYHAYSGKPGTYTITATITDSGGNKGTVSTSFTTDGTEFTPYGPTRLLDTRTTGARVPAGGTARVKVGGAGSIPADVKAVAMNVTVTNPSGNGHVTAYADGTPRPVTSNVNYAAGQTVPNMTITPVGANGYVDLYNSDASADLIADVSGYFTTSDANAFTTVSPARLLDTRTTGTPLVADQPATLAIAGAAGGQLPASGITAVTLNVTVTNPAAGGFLTAYPSGADRPSSSNLNFTPGQTVANAVIVPVGPDGKISLYSIANTDVVVDVSGYFSARGTASYVPITPLRQADTRDGTGQAGGPKPISGGTTTSFDLTRNIPHLSRWVTSVVLNATATNTTGTGFLTVFYPGSGTTPPPTSNLNWTAGQTVPNLVVAQVLNGLNGVASENFYVSSTTDMVVDVSGYFAATYAG